MQSHAYVCVSFTGHKCVCVSRWIDTGYEKHKEKNINVHVAGEKKG